MKRVATLLPGFAAFALLTAFATVVPAGARAQSAEVRGVVEDAQTGETLPGASVVAVREGSGRRRGAATGADGSFRIGGLPAGRYVVEVSYVGYAAVERAVTLAEGQTRTFAVPLVPESLRGEDVVVTGEWRLEDDERGLGVERITPAEIKDLPTPFEPDVFRALQLLPGVKAASDFSSGLYIRGGSPAQTLVRLGETTVYNPTHFFGFFSTFNPDAIGDVRLFKGGFPAVYGGRLGAVVDLENRAGSPEGLSGTASAGLLASRVAVDGPLPGALSDADAPAGGAWMVAARRSTLEPLFAGLRALEVDGIPDRFNFYDLNARADTWLSERDRLTASAYLGADYIDFPFLDEAQVEVPYGNRAATLAWTRLWSEDTFSEVAASASRYFNDPVFELAGNTFRRSNTLTDVAATAAVEMRMGAHTVRTGVRGSFFTTALERKLDDQVLFSPTTRTGRLSAYAQDTWRPGGGVRGGSPWRIVAGVRAAYHTRGQFARLGPRLSVQYRPPGLDGRVRVQAGYGRYHQYLSLLSSEFFSGADTWYAAGEGVAPSYGDQFVGGVKVDVAETLRLDVEGYYRTMRDLFEIDPFTQDAAGLPYAAAFQFGEGYAYGLEAKLERTEGRLSGFFAYTLAQTRRRFPFINVDVRRREALSDVNARNVLGGAYPPKYDRRHDFKAVANYDFAEKWRATGVFTYATGQPFTRPQSQYRLQDDPGRETTRNVLVSPYNGARLPAYHRLDVGVRRLGRLFGLDTEFQVQLLNAYNQRNVWFYFYETEDDGIVSREEIPQLPVPLPNVSVTVEF